MAKTLTIAVISDLHCRHSGGKSKTDLNTYLISDEMPNNRHPIFALKKEILESEIEADIVICPGDITDKIDEQGFISGWKFLEDIKTALNAKSLFATLGNHDVDSRNHKGWPTVFELAKNISPDFPTAFEDKNQFFWAKNYCLIDEENCLILNINTAYSHTNVDNASRCIIDRITIDSINAELEPFKQSEKHKICFLHHHPLQHSNMTYRDSDFVDNGDDFLAVLEKHGFTLVIHGHKHDPRINYRNKLPVFASGSFSSMMNIMDLKADNTFHLITLSNESKKGTINTWVYGPKFGWKRKNGTYFPTLTGFGNSTPLEELAKQCNDYLTEIGKEFASFEQVQKRVPDIVYLIPEEQSRIEKILIDTYQLCFTPSLSENPNFLIKTTRI